MLGLEVSEALKRALQPWHNRATRKEDLIHPYTPPSTSSLQEAEGILRQALQELITEASGEGRQALT